MDWIVPVDESLARNAAHRSLAGPPEDAILGCGFLRKPPGYRADHILFRHYGGLLVLKGTGTYVDHDGTVTPVGPGDFVQRMPGRRHASTVDAGGEWRECYIVFGQRFFRNLLDLGCVDADRPVLRPGMEPSLVRRFLRMREDLASVPDRALPRLLVRMHALLTEIVSLDREGRGRESADDWVERFCHILGEDLDARAPLTEMAADLPVGYERLRKLFAERLGISPGEYRLRRRLDRARSLLARRELSIKEIAARLGYPDAFAFSRQFRQRAGHSPRQFRKGL